jgi:hypothetical protein
MIFSQQNMQFLSFVRTWRRHYCDLSRAALVVGNLAPEPPHNETR